MYGTGKKTKICITITLTCTPPYSAYSIPLIYWVLRDTNMQLPASSSHCCWLLSLSLSCSVQNMPVFNLVIDDWFDDVFSTTGTNGLMEGNAAISENGETTRLPSLGPSNNLFIFLDLLYFDLISEHERGLGGPHLPTYILFDDNVTFHRDPLIRGCFTADPKMVMVFLRSL